MSDSNLPMDPAEYATGSTSEAAEAAAVASRSASRLSVGARRFVRHRLGMTALVALGLLVVVAVVGPLVWRYGYTDITPDLSQAPSVAHPMGTDSLGRDLLAMVMRGMQQSLLIATSVTVIATVLAVFLGVVSGFLGGLVDAAVMRLVDLVLTLPTLALAAFLGNMVAGRGVTWFGLALVLGSIMWTGVARLVRGVVLGLRAMPYVDAARVMGASPSWIMFKHLAPNVTDHIVVGSTLMFGHAILAESALSFLGFGVQPPDTSLGLLVAQAQSAVLTRPWLFFFPGLLVVVLVLTINYIGEGLRDSFNPRAEASDPLRDRKHGGAAASPSVAVGAPTEIRATAAAANPLVTMRGWTVSFGGARVVDDIDLDIATGEVLALVGESGSGKSLTAMSLVGLLPNTARTDGAITFDGAQVQSLTYPEWQRIRGRGIATILQDPSTALNPVLTIGDHFTDTIRTTDTTADRDECRRRAIELMTSVAIPRPEMRVDQFPHQLSGGLRQRISIALAMVHSPSLIIADEPTTALDVTVQAQVMATLKLALARTGAAMLFITHDLARRRRCRPGCRHATGPDRGACGGAGPVRRPTPPVHPQAACGATPTRDRSGGGMTHVSAPDEDDAPILVVDSLCKHFEPPRSERRKGTKVIHALCSASLQVRPGETVGVVGESGSGKSTLLRTILGLERATAGSVEFQGRRLTTFGDSATRALRREISVVFQDPYSSLDPRMTVADIVAEPRRIHSGDTSPGAIADLLELVELPRGVLERFPHEFSGGQRQRIAIARSLALAPKLVVLDEPVSALDVSVQATILELLVRLQREQGVSYLLVSHDLAVVADIAARVCVMYGGHVVESGPTTQVLRRPAHPYTRMLLDAVPVPDPRVEKAKVVSTVRAWPTEADPLPPCPVGDRL